MKKYKPEFAIGFAPATVANVAVGFDILGFAINGLGEWAYVEKIPNSKSVIIEPITHFPNLPLDPNLNTATAGLVELIKNKNLNFGFRVRLKKQIPIGSGLGGSSSSAVATIVACQALLKKKLTQDELLYYSLIGEEVASQSRHADNIAPCLYGGLVFVKKNHIPAPTKKIQSGYDVISIKYPKNLYCVIILPDASVKTSEARKILASTVSLKSHILQTANLTGFILGCQQNNFKLIKESLSDEIIEPQRKQLVPNFDDIKSEVIKAGALGCSLSGSGPAVFALCEGLQSANTVKHKVVLLAKKQRINLKGIWVSEVSKSGAKIVKKII